MPSTRPLKVVITGAAGNIGGYAIFSICKGSLLGPDQLIDLALLEIPQAQKALQGVMMEVNDGCFPVVNSILATSDYKEAFTDADLVFLIGAKPRSPGMTRADLLSSNSAIFKGQGAALNKYASRNVKVVVVGNPANTNCLIAMANAPDLDASCFSALTRLDQSRATGMLATKVGVPVRQVHNAIIWGNHSATQFPDVSQAYISDHPQPGLTSTVTSVVNDDEWLNGNSGFIPMVQKRGAAVLKARGKSSAASAANAAVDHMRSWCLGTKPGEIVSMATLSDGSYGVPKGIIFSYPTTITNGVASIVTGFTLNQAAKDRLKATADELLSERSAALGSTIPAALKARM